ncbi:MAG: sugar phosphate isomerase/epimerase [Chloroflexi bacterium]|nr:sugar phosphate isomerase/epimerase [Chloroflexota bacterium]
MRLGGPIFGATDPDAWIAALAGEGYRAAYWPLPPGAPDDDVARYVRAAERHDIVIAEVGAWSNPLSPDNAERHAAIDKCCASLAVADRVGARCCVNITGSRGSKWDGPDARDLTRDTFDLIVETVRGIIDAVKPTRSYYALETMQWMYPDSVAAYVHLIKAIDRPRLGVHLDPTNLVCSPQIYYRTGPLIRLAFRKLGPQLRSCHAKDIALGSGATVHLDEVRPGLGNLDYATYLCELARCDPDLPLMLEHLPNADEYRLAAAHIRGVAHAQGLTL